MWIYLRNKRLNGLKFFRQYSVGGYILDFYCPKIRLAIELDGSQHGESESVIYDKTRDEYLSLLDIKVIRFWNKEVIENINEVLTKIKQKTIEMEKPPLM